jgi:ribosomal protein S3
VVVDDCLSLLGRRLATQDAGAQAVRHGQQADGLGVRVQVGGRAAGGLGRPQLGGDHVGHGV